MITPEEFLNRISIEDQLLQRKHPAGSDWTLLKLLQSFVRVNETEKLLHQFWQRSSDACPLEATQAEREEKEFEIWVKEQQNKE